MSEPRPHPRLVATPTEPSDDALFALVQAGDRQAFARLVARHEAAIRRFVAVTINDREAARDVAQEVFILAWDQRARYRPEGRLRVWLLALAKNLARRERRRLTIRRWLGLEHVAEVAAPIKDSDEVLVDAERDAVVRASLGRLPPKMHEALVLRYADELDYDQMAEVLGENASTLRSRVHYGLAKLGLLVPEEVMR